VPKRECAPALIPFVPNDTFFVNQWGLQRIEAPRAWPICQGDPGVVIAVLDQGVELAHPDLNLFPVSYSTITHTNDGSPVGNHGTACAGIIASKIDNANGAAGLAPKCRVMAIATNFADTEVAEGLYYAADNGARVVSMSFGVYPSWMMWNFAIIEAALQYCHEHNVVLVAATGNEDQVVSRFPATDPRTFGIGGSNRDDVRKSIGDGSVEAWWGACYGPDCDVVAPCLEIPTTDRLGAAGYSPTDYDLRFNGTSSATPHVAALAGLVLSIDGSLSNLDVYRILAETADKINSGPGGYVYAQAAGKPYGSWNNDVGYGRINAERALLAACAVKARRRGEPCHLPEPEPCCVSPCDPRWLSDETCIVWYDDRFFREPILRDNRVIERFTAASPFIEFRITFEHRLCRLGKQHGSLLYTTTLLPGETVRLYHSDRYRRITSTQQRFSVETTFMQFLSIVHQARVSNTLDALAERLSSSRSSSSSESGGGFFFGLFGGGGTSSSSSSSGSTSVSSVSLEASSETFNQSVLQSSQLTHAERSIVISTFEDKESVDVSVRTLSNPNECRAVTYFVRQVIELYAMATRVVSLSYRLVAPNTPADFHDITDIDWLPAAIRNQILETAKLLPKVGQVLIRPRPISLPTDGVVYDPELANCCSCEPERAAAIQIRLKKEEAEALKVTLEAKKLELELERRRLLLTKGELGPFEPAQG
jgi:thermitase